MVESAASSGWEESLDAPATWLEKTLEQLTQSTVLSVSLTIIIALAFTWLASRAITKLIRTLMEREVLNISHTSLFVNIFRVLVWGVGISVILSSCFGIDMTALLAAVGIGGVALSLGMQDTVANLIGGLQVSILGIVKPGDYVTVSGCQGIVQDVTWRHTTIKDFSGSTFIIPNKSINTSSVTILPPSRKIKVKVCFNENPGKDLEVLKKNMLIAVKNEVGKVAHVDKDPVFRFDTITEYCFEGYVVIWVNTQPVFDIYDVKDAICRACAPYSRASEMRDDLVATPSTKGAVKPVKHFEERVSADEVDAIELLSEEDFIRDVKGVTAMSVQTAAAEAAATAAATGAASPATKA